MSEFFNNHGTALIFWTSFTLICVVPSIAAYWWKVRKAETEAALKHDMLARGMSAEEIERVLAASPGSKCKQRIRSSEPVDSALPPV